MARPPAIADLRAALRERRFPTVTIWNRVEGRPRATEFERALRAEVRDPLWMLARQWQFGEFQGEDAGSPVTATYHVRTAQPARYHAREAPPVELSDRLPWETVVEAQPLPFTGDGGRAGLDLRVAMGRHWIKLMGTLPAAVPAAVRDKIAARWPIATPDPAADADVPLVAHPDVWAVFQAVAGRIPDGYDLYAHLAGGGRPYDGVSGLTAQHKLLVDGLIRRFTSWFEGLVAQPTGPSAYDPARLEHRFGVDLDDGTELAATEFTGGTLDWHSFSYQTAGGPPSTTAVTRTVVPGEVRFAGMPLPRWWSFEDGRTDFGAIAPDRTDLIKTLLMEFALVYSDDWFLLPCDLPEGTLSRVAGVVVTDVFGVRSWITPAGTGLDDDWQRWSLFNLDVAGTAPVDANLGVLLPPNLSVSEGPPVEDVLLVRDENANLVWGIERTVWPAAGAPMPGEEAARETLAYRQRLHPQVGHADPAAPIAYESMNTVPENWIPFIPVHVPGDSREVQLRRGAMPRILEGQTPRVASVRPRTSLLRHGLDSGEGYVVHEEEVPRAGTRLTAAFRRTRRADGRPVIWLGVRRSTGRGEASSGLDWDRVVDDVPVSLQRGRP